jgi:glutathione synthase/RimK-type ligase-like ATP-grasp enzyme
MTRQQAGQAPGIVKIRLSGAARDVAVMAALLTGDDGCGIDVIEQPAPYPNHRDPGQRGVPDRPDRAG